jgi:hypothetical protein
VSGVEAEADAGDAENAEAVDDVSVEADVIVMSHSNTYHPLKLLIHRMNMISQSQLLRSLFPAAAMKGRVSQQQRDAQSP